MAETYTVSAQLNMRSNVPEVIEQMVRGFETVNRLIKDTQNNLGRMAADLRALSGANRGFSSLTKSLEKLTDLKMNGSLLTDMRDMLKITRDMEAAQAALAKSTQATAAAQRSMAAATRRVAPAPGVPVPGVPGGAVPGITPPGITPHPGGRGSPPGQRPSHANLADTAIGLQMGGDAGTSFFEESVKAELEVQKLLTSFRQNTTLKPSDIAAIRGKAEELVRSVPGTTVAENLHTLLDAYTIVGDLGEAMGGAEGMAKLNLLFSSMQGAKGEDGGFKAGMAIELMQKFYDPKTHQMDIGAFNKQIAAIAQVAAGTGDRAGPDAYLAFVKQARVSSMVANDQFLYRDAPATMIALGGSRMGTGMAALFAQFQTGTMTKNAYRALMGAGLLDKKAEWAGGRMQDIGHHLRGADLNAKNMVDWVRQEILGPKGAIAEKGIDPDDKVAVARFLSSFTGRQTGLGVLAEMILGIGNINKEATKIGQTNADPLAVAQATDPNMKVKAFHAAENELMVTVGQALLGPAIDGIKALTVALRDVSDWAKANPTAAKDIAATAAGMALLSKAAGDLAMIVFIGSPVVTGMAALTRSLSPFGAGGAASGAVATMAGGGVGSLGALAGAIVGLAAAAGVAVAVPGLFAKLNAYLGMPDTPAGREAHNAANPSPHGNRFIDGLFDWWNGVNNTPAPDGHGNAARGAHQGAAGGVHPSSFTSPSAADGRPLQLKGDVILDHQKLGTFTAQSIAKGLSGASSGSTGFDPRMTPMPTGATPLN